MFEFAVREDSKVRVSDSRDGRREGVEIKVVVFLVLFSVSEG